MGYATFVSRARRYVYVETPKAACTAFKRLIVEIEGVTVDERAPPYHRESRLDMLIHQRRYVQLPTLLDLARDEFDEILEGRGDWFVFALVRNPFSRLVSVFESKVRLGEPRYRHLEARFGDAAAPGGRAQAFAAFVEEVVADERQMLRDEHLRPQWQLLMPRLIRYRQIFKFEAIGAALEALRSHIRAQGGNAEFALAARNTSPPHDWRSHYGEHAAAIVARVYARDFASFGYDPNDWAMPRGERPAEESPVEKYWRAEVVARNALIDYLYDLLKPRRSPSAGAPAKNYSRFGHAGSTK